MATENVHQPPDVDIRTRIIDAAQRCFYRDGINSTGVDTLAAEAGVSKRTLYNHFGSKDGLVTAYLERREQRWRRKLADQLERAGDDPIAQIVAYVRGYGVPPDDTEFRGCGFVIAAAELADEGHPALDIIRGSIANVEQGIAEVLADAGVAHAGDLAAEIVLMLEGAIAVAGVRRSDHALDVAEQAIVRTVRQRLHA